MTDRGAIDRLLVLAKELGNHLGPGAGDARPPRSLAVIGEYRPGVEGARRSGLSGALQSGEGLHGACALFPPSVSDRADRGLLREAKLRMRRLHRL